MNERDISKIEDMILDLVESVKAEYDDIATSDLQAMVGALTRQIIIKVKKAG
jgi:hypothetical protein